MVLAVASLEIMISLEEFEWKRIAEAPAMEGEC